MESTTPTSIDTSSLKYDYGSWYWFIFITVIFGIIWYYINNAVNILEISQNWSKYRCSPAVMPFASVYGYDTNENFNYCLKQMFQGQVGGVTGPFASIMSSIVKNMMTFLENLNSLRIMMATLVGGVTKVFQEFVDRFRLVISQVKVAGLRIQMLMRRLFGTFYAVIYMGLSAVTVGQNFADTFIFRFLDTFCFAPETLIDIKKKGLIPIKDVKLGDICSLNNQKVVSTYTFLADGQTMVKLDNILISTNHLVKYNNNWIDSKDHKDAIIAPNWKGGIDRPLICLDTERHEIPIKDYIFSDWDETHDSDIATMCLSESILNGFEPVKKERPWKYQPAIDLNTHVVMKDGSHKPVKDLTLGEELSCGIVCGIGRRLIDEVCLTTYGSVVTPSTLIWSSYEFSWIRAGHLVEPTRLPEPIPFATILVLGSPPIELSTGEFIRDMMEVCSPIMEEPTSSILKKR